MTKIKYRISRTLNYSYGGQGYVYRVEEVKTWLGIPFSINWKGTYGSHEEALNRVRVLEEGEDTFLVVHVTAEHIKRGIKWTGVSCPVALALRESDFKKATVGTHLWYPNGRDPDRLPLEATLFINRFDLGFPVEPFSFKIKKQL